MRAVNRQPGYRPGRLVEPCLFAQLNPILCKYATRIKTTPKLHHQPIAKEQKRTPANRTTTQTSLANQSTLAPKPTQPRATKHTWRPNAYALKRKPLHSTWIVSNANQRAHTTIPHGLKKKTHAATEINTTTPKKPGGNQNKRFQTSTETEKIISR